MSGLETEWIIADPPDDHPGYLGARRTAREQEWSQKYGNDNWRYSWKTADGRIMDFNQAFQVYVDGYIKYFEEHRDEAEYLGRSYSYGYDLDLITREQAFDPYALYRKPGVRNQFHHVAFNIAIERVRGKHFEGADPIQVQVREGRPGTPDDQQPAGFRWSPGRIPCVDPSIIPQVKLEREQWWQNGTVEDFYQRAKIVQVRRTRRLS